MRLRTVLFGVLLFTAVIPVAGFIFLRLYENTLVRQTESELIMQGAVMAAVHGEALARAIGSNTGYGLAFRRPKASARSYSFETSGYGPAGSDPIEFTPVFPTIDLSTDEILPDRAAGKAAAADPIAKLAAAHSADALLQATQTTLAGLRVLDFRGVVVAGRSEVGTSLAHLREVRQALDGRHASVLRKRSDYQPRYNLEYLSRASNIRVSYARPVIVNNRVAGVVLLARSPRTLFRGIYQDIGKFALGAVLILLVVTGLAAVLSRSITRPIDTLTRATRRIAQGQSTLPPAPRTAASEIQELFANFAAMADTIDRRSSYIRDFAAAVSHEFKTPLAAIQGAIELLHDHGAEMAADEREKFFANLSSDADRLNRLVTRLLQLAKADVLTPADDACQLDCMLETMAERFSDSSFAVRVVPGGSAATVRLSQENLETVLSNLITNSRQHGAEEIAISSQIANGFVHVFLQDNGHGVASGDEENLFKPFFTTRRDTGGTGLGLAIIKSLLTAHGGSIRLRSGEDGACFELRLPIVRASELAN
jgi:signal transduction histidine kinase